MIQVELWAEGRYRRTIDLPALPAKGDDLVIESSTYQVLARGFHANASVTETTIRLYVRAI